MASRKPLRIKNPFTDGEGPLHRYAKEEINRALLGGFDHLYFQSEVNGRCEQYRLPINGLRPIMECTYPMVHVGMTYEQYKVKYKAPPSMIFDVALVDSRGDVMIVLEVAHKHWMDSVKCGKLAASRIVAIEICHKVADWHPQRNRLSAVNAVIPKRPATQMELWSSCSWRVI